MSNSVLHISTDSGTEAPHLIPLVQELRQFNQWVSFRVTPDPSGGKTKKHAYTPGTNSLAKSTTRDTWGTFDAAMADVAAGRAQYVGFVPTADDPYAVIDWDGCLDPETGEFTDPDAEAEFRACPGYKERSQSKQGCHAVVRGVRPGDRKKIGNFECYDEGQMIIFTLDVVDGHNTIRNGQKWLTETYNRRFPPEKPYQQPTPEPIIIGDADEFTADEIIDRLLNHRDKGAKFRELFDGGWGQFGSNSEARFSIMGMCNPYTRLPETMEEVLRRSGLWTDKLEKRPTLVREESQRIIDNYRGPRASRKPQHIVGGIDQETGEILEPPEPPEPPAGAECGEIVAHLRQRLAQVEQENRELRRDYSMLLAFVLNPNIKSADKFATAAIIDLTCGKATDKDGYVALKAGEISNDWRRKPNPGENTEPFNPDGSKPRMSRSSVPRVMRKLAGIDDDENPSPKLIDATPDFREVKPKNGGQPWTETIWLVKKPTSVAEFLAPIAAHDPEEKATRKARAIPCPECNEVHPTSVQMIRRNTCFGCGHVWEDSSKPKIVQPIIEIHPDAADPDPGDQISPVTSVSNTTGDNLSPKGPHPTPLRPEPTLSDRFAAGGWE